MAPNNLMLDDLSAIQERQSFVGSCKNQHLISMTSQAQI